MFNVRCSTETNEGPSNKVAAIDLNRLRANFDVAMARTKRARQLTLLGRSEAKFLLLPRRRTLRLFQIQRHAAITGFILKPTISLPFVR